jgi:hypothetical protein
MPSQNEAIPGMQESMMQSSQQDSGAQYGYVPQDPYQQGYQDQSQGYQDQYSGEYQQYDYQQQGISTDTIAEISEQILSEKMTEMRKHLEKTMDFKSTAEAKIDHIDERIKRIEKIIDTLQTSILRKVGDYVTNVEDIKKELVETQKSFTKLLPELKEKAKHSHSGHHSEHPRKQKRKSHKCFIRPENIL